MKSECVSFNLYSVIMNAWSLGLGSGVFTGLLLSLSYQTECGSLIVSVCIVILHTKASSVCSVTEVCHREDESGDKQV